MKSRIMYIELKSGYSDDGPARIGRVTFTKSGRGVRYQGRLFYRVVDYIGGNHIEEESGESYWISGCKKNGEDRHRCGFGPVEIDEDVREEYWTEIRRMPENKDRKTT